MDEPEPPAPPPPVLAARQTADQPDLIVDAYQVHVIYAVPADGIDRELDRDGTIAGTAAASNRFFEDASGGKTIRYDLNLEGELDVTYLAMPREDAFYAEQGVFARDALETDVLSAGFTDAQKAYLVYYEGANNAACGSGPALGTGDPVAALYLKGTPSGTRGCESSRFAGADDTPGFWEWVAAHEVLHILAFVDPCAPRYNAAAPSHVGDSPSDLMYAGPEPWFPTTVDIDQDDYYGAGVPAGCGQNLFFSAFLEPQDGDQIPTNFHH